MKKLTLLGSTGSIGLNTLDVVREFPQQFRIEALSCRSSIKQLAEQIREFQPRIVCVDKDKQAGELRHIFPDTKFVCGMKGLMQISTDPGVDLVVSGIVGAAGLKPTFSALKAGKTVAVANKEPLVMAGELFIQTAIEAGAKLLPADSEHNAIFQALNNEPPESIARLILTASGGSLRDHPLNEFEHITPAQALDHPNWEMGSKITIDSATMMNKGLEVIEAHWLFDTPVQNIEVVMHRESIIHSMVEFVDGSFLAQMGLPDMRVPLAHCLGWPERLPLKIPRMDPVSLKALHFEAIDPKRFPCLSISIKAAKQGGGAPAVLNGANEKVVASFLEEDINFLDISKTLHSVMQQFYKTISLPEVPSFLKHIHTIEDAVKADQWGREQAMEIMS